MMETMESVLADTYVLYLKTQNYHWNIISPNFRDYHLLLQDMYEALAVAADDLAEQIRIIGRNVPATFDFFRTKTCLKDGDCTLPAKQMLMDLLGDHQKILETITKAIAETRDAQDVGTEDLLIERVRYHSKMVWFLKSITA